MFRPAFRSTHRIRSPTPFARPAGLSLGAAARDSAGYEFPKPCRWRTRPNRPPRATQRWNRLDSSREPASKRNSKMTKVEMIATVMGLTSRFESWVKSHAAIDEQGGALDVV